MYYILVKTFFLSIYNVKYIYSLVKYINNVLSINIVEMKNIHSKYIYRNIYIQYKNHLIVIIKLIFNFVSKLKYYL